MNFRIPTCVQGRGRIPDLLLQVPIAPLHKDYVDGRFARQKKAKRNSSGPLYEMSFEEGAVDEKGGLIDVSTIGFDRIRVMAVNMIVHPIRDVPETIAFIYAPEDEPVRVRVPVRCVNQEKCPGLRDAGWLNRLLWSVEVRVAPFTKAPLFVTMDLNGMKMSDKGKIGDLQFEGKGEGCETILPDDTFVTCISSV